jgi:membrane-associated phospholipid phosphatase
VTFIDNEVIYPEFAYPMRNEIIPIWAAALMAALIPIAVFLIVQIRVRSFWDVNNATIGLFYALITAAVFQVFVKWLIGGLRPHFLAVCKPDVTGLQVGNGYRQIMYDRKICTGDESEINDSLESMPSGHTTAAFAGFVFLYLYLNAKLKVFSNYHPAMWKLIVLYMPILGAVLIGGALTIDEYHNWYDVFAGAVIGTTMAFSAYRMVYASVWDFRCKFFAPPNLPLFFLQNTADPKIQSTISPSSATPPSSTALVLTPSTASTTQPSPAKPTGAPTMPAPGAVLPATLRTLPVAPWRLPLVVLLALLRATMLDTPEV